ncbi:hypothetical protein LWI28_002508 [Acer negundo]|uniref:non-specific serine/threonine protein kinase n=1 Tax=Acer negundo TaxID=4023 RepID=A0AAD5NW60_ACENE|nr:hypothetical protein LWI28_002508 [Acer negundo]
MNNFAGNLQGLDNCSYSLKELHVDVNSLSGHLPDELPNVFGNLTNLQFFIANSILVLCSKLHVLDLLNNSLTGSIYLNFTGLPSLGILVLASNRFSGPLPNSLADCHQLKILNLDKNNFTGQVPDNFAKLQSLLFLSLSNNSFVDISRALSVLQQCKNLTTLIFAKNVNGFESLMALGIGEIPTNLTELKSLISTNCCSSNLTSAADSSRHRYITEEINKIGKGNITANIFSYRELFVATSNFNPENMLCEALDWNTRMKIARAAAKGLEYLHESASPPVIYSDFKASNILLDKDFNAKLSDLGLAKLGPTGDKTHVYSFRVLFLKKSHQQFKTNKRAESSYLGMLQLVFSTISCTMPSTPLV